MSKKVLVNTALAGLVATSAAFAEEYSNLENTDFDSQSAVKKEYHSTDKYFNWRNFNNLQVPLSEVMSQGGVFDSPNSAEKLHIVSDETDSPNKNLNQHMSRKAYDFKDQTPNVSGVVTYTNNVEEDDIILLSEKSSEILRAELDKIGINSPVILNKIKEFIVLHEYAHTLTHQELKAKDLLRLNRKLLKSMGVDVEINNTLLTKEEKAKIKGSSHLVGALNENPKQMRMLVDEKESLVVDLETQADVFACTLIAQRFHHEFQNLDKAKEYSLLFTNSIRDWRHSRKSSDPTHNTATGLEQLSKKIDTDYENLLKMDLDAINQFTATVAKVNKMKIFYPIETGPRFFEVAPRSESVQKKPKSSLFSKARKIQSKIDAQQKLKEESSDKKLNNEQQDLPNFRP